MATRSYEIEGERWTPLMDVAKEAQRYDSVVRKYLAASGGSVKLIAPGQFERKLTMMRTKDVPALLDLLKGVPHKPKHRRHRRTLEAQAPNGSVESGQAPTSDTATASVEFIQALRKVKALAGELGIKLDELVFENGEAHFPRLKLEVVRL